MPVYGIVINNKVTNIINADDESIALPIAKHVSLDAFVVEIKPDEGGVGWIWDGTKLVQETPIEEITVQQEGEINANI